MAVGAAALAHHPDDHDVGRQDDPRLPAIREAVEFWNRTLAGLPTSFRLGAMIRVDGTIPGDVLADLSERTLRGMWIRQHPRLFDAFDGDILIVLSDAEFFSVSSRIGDRALIAIKNSTRAPLSLPNVLHNGVAHELGHVLGSRTTLTRRR